MILDIDIIFKVGLGMPFIMILSLTFLHFSFFIHHYNVSYFVQIGLWSPALDALGNTVRWVVCLNLHLKKNHCPSGGLSWLLSCLFSFRGVSFAEKFIEKFNFHRCARLSQMLTILCHYSDLTTCVTSQIRLTRGSTGEIKDKRSCTIFGIFFTGQSLLLEDPAKGPRRLVGTQHTKGWTCNFVSFNRKIKFVGDETLESILQLRNMFEKQKVSSKLSFN